MDNRPIGIFDSRIGGLTVFKELRELLPEQSIIYLGDTARVPYGSKNRETIIGYAHDDVDFLCRFNVKAIAVACNTVDSNATDYLSSLGLPIFHLIEPTCMHAVKVSENKKIGVIATPATVKTGRYQSIIKEINKDVEVYAAGCEKLTGYAEAGRFDADDQEVYEYVNDCLKPLKEAGIDTLILGCTHYPLLTAVIKKCLPEVKIVSSSKQAAYSTYEGLKANGLLPDNTEALYRFYTSGDILTFRDVASKILDKDLLTDISHVDL